MVLTVVSKPLKYDNSCRIPTMVSQFEVKVSEHGTVDLSTVTHAYGFQVGALNGSRLKHSGWFYS